MVCENNGREVYETLNSPSSWCHITMEYLRVVRKVVVFSYEGEDLLVLALTFAKVPRRGSRKLFFSAKVFCGLQTGSWSDEPCVFTGSARRMPAD